MMLGTLPLAIATLVSGCGGGGGDDAGERVGFLTITSASASDLDGSYGEGSANVTEVVKLAATGADPEVCSFGFSGADRIGGSGTAAGDVRYQPNADSVYRIRLTVRGRDFSTGNADGSDTDIHHSRDIIELSRKRLTATDGSGDTLRATGLIPMRGGRPAGC